MLAAKISRAAVEVSNGFPVIFANKIFVFFYLNFAGRIYLSNFILMRILFLSLCFLTISATAIWAQIPLDGIHYADSLTEELQKNVPVENKVRACFLLSEYYLNKDTLQAQHYLQKGRQFANGNRYLSDLYLFYDAQYHENPNPAEAEKLYVKCDSILSKYKGKESLIYRSRCWSRYAFLQKKKDDHKKYIDILLNQSLPLAVKAGDSNIIANYYLDVAIGFKNILDYDAAESYLKQAIATLKNNNGSPSFLASAYHTLAEDYSLSGKPEQAGPLLDSMKALLQPYPQSEKWLDYYAGHTMYLTVCTKFNEALTEVNKGIALAQKLHQSYPMQRLLMQKFYVLFNQSNFFAAKDVMLSLLQYKEMTSIATNRIQMYYGLALTYDSLHEMRNAYTWMSKYAALNDSVNKSKIENDMNALKVKYEAGEKERRISVLESQKQQAELKAKNSKLTNWLLIAASAIFLIAFGSLLFYFNNNKKLALQKEINYRQQLKELEQKQQLSTTEAILEGEERERRRMARDLHDGLGGMLAGIKIKLSSENKNEEKDKNNLHHAINQLDNAVSELRRIARNMMPESLMRFGLETALKDLCDSLITDKTQIGFENFGIDPKMDLSKQVLIYRIIQEALNNAIRHAEAKNILLQCSQNENTFFITVEDDGKGFDINANQKKQGIGLSNITTRVKYLKGKMDIATAPNEGTTINVELNVAA